MNNVITVLVLSLIEVISIIFIAKRYGKGNNIALFELGVGTLFCLVPLLYIAVANFSTSTGNGADASPLFWFMVVNGSLVALATYLMHIFYVQQREVRA